MDKRATIIVGLTYGDEGKGSWTDYFAQKEGAQLIVRYNGGPQAAHNVVLPNGVHHTFSQFGSGSFVPGVKTFLSRFMLVDLVELHLEAVQLDAKGYTDCLDRLFIDFRAKLVTPYHAAANRLRERARGTFAHGSCGMGIGETVTDWLNGGPQLTVSNITKEKLEDVRKLKLFQLSDIIQDLKDDPSAETDIQILTYKNHSKNLYEFYQNFLSDINIVGNNFLKLALDETEHSVFEGAQGVLLDQDYGFQPHTTWSRTTAFNARKLLGECYFPQEAVKTLGLMPPYPHRHGAGPLRTEKKELTTHFSSNELHNVQNDWQGGFRFGYTDIVALKYALDYIPSLDSLAISHLDQMLGLDWRYCTAYYKNPKSPSGNTPGYLGQYIQDLYALVNLPSDESIVQKINSCSPMYTNFGIITESNTLEFLDTIEKYLGKKFTHYSMGPTADDKYVMQSAMA